MNALIIYQALAAAFCIVSVFTAGYYLGYRRNLRRFQSQVENDRTEMLTIERALKEFWDHEKAKLEGEKQELVQKIRFLETKLDQYRRKAAGIGMMGLRKSKLTDMFVSLLIENETLEEKLFMQNLKLKQERDEALENELRHISYKRILLSELLSQSDVRREMERAISDKGKMKRLELRQRDIDIQVPESSDDSEDGSETSGM